MAVVAAIAAAIAVVPTTVVPATAAAIAVAIGVAAANDPHCNFQQAWIVKVAMTVAFHRTHR